ncbi:expressed unknown protein [Seminavis robusta]|uniref:Uncharacterized protein n=1 Tax=Seminavis robusta TaxID=568900 RepID=A0A9N8HD54_9STRA|nr:expressed unknown protein [Seminavis robusta]|eukprot:Sro346_g122640.1 n/a (298) ;mRNA; r:21521-22414
MEVCHLWLLLGSLVVRCPSVGGSEGEVKDDAMLTATTKYLRQASTPKERGLALPHWFCSFFDETAPDHPCDNHTNGFNVTCPLVQPLSNQSTDFDMQRFIERSWFVQKQQVNGFQPSVEDDFFCLVHTWLNRTEDEFFDYLHFGTVGSIDGPQQEWDVGFDALPPALSSWCSGQDEHGGGYLRISPCLLRPLLGKVGIPLWVLAVAADDSWAIISGGEPETVRQIDPPLCTTRINVSAEAIADTSGTGLWLLTRARIASNDTLAEMEQLLLDMGIFTGDLFPVVQEGCSYEGTTLIE